MDIRSMHGFSIIEVAAALAITGIAAAIAIPNWNRLIPVYQLDSSTRQLQSELHTIKSRAVSENASFQLQYTAGAAHYSIQRDATVVNTKPLPDGVVIIKTGSVSFSPRRTAGSNS